MCVGEVKSKGQGELEKDIANLKSALLASGAERGFMNAASPGVISLFLQNDYYPSRENYLEALANAMKAEYETIVAAGLDLQLDCPDLAQAGYVLFETSNPRHGHEWTVFKDRKADIPDDKILVPGVVDTTTNFVEHPDLVAQRLERFVNIVGRDRVIAGSDCGFGTFAGFGTVDPEIAYAKLASLSQGAQKV